MDKVNRRKVLTVAATAAVAIGVPAAAYAVGLNPTGSAPSPELIEWREARRLYWEAGEASHAATRGFAAAYVANHPSRGAYELVRTFRRPEELRAHLFVEGPIDPVIMLDEPGFIAGLLADPAVIAAGRAETSCLARLDASIAVLVARPVRSWDDVAELAELAWGESRWFAGDRHPDDDLLPDRNLVALYDAIRTLSGRPMPPSAIEHGPGSEGGADV